MQFINCFLSQQLDLKFPLTYSIELPVFTLELHDVAVNERDTVTLEVVVSGNSPYEVEWFKNAVDVTESDRISLVMHNEGRFALVIRDCEDDDTGEYCCVAQNEAGRVTCAGWLTVEGRKLVLNELYNY